MSFREPVEGHADCTFDLQMKLLQAAAAVFALCSIFSSLASAQLTQTVVSPTDLQQIEAVVNAEVPMGAFRGLPLNTTVRRPVLVLNAGPNEASLDRALSAPVVEVANFYHDGLFYVARIPLEQLVDVRFLVAPFSAVAWHTQLQFVFAPNAPIELIAKINDHQIDAAGNKRVTIEPLATPIQIKDLVMTIDGTEPRGQKSWNMLDAIRGRYTITYRLVSIQERVRWFIMTGTPIKPYNLNLSPEEARATIKLGLRKSHTIRFTRPYSLLTANCTNLALKLVAEAVPFKSRSLEKYSPLIQSIRALYDRVENVSDTLSWFTIMRLRVLGWLERREINLERDPEFRREVEFVIEDYRRAIEREPISEEAKRELLAKLGIDEREEVLKTPKRFKAALAEFNSHLKARGGSKCGGAAAP